MSNIKSQFRTLIQSKSINEMFGNITWDMIDCIAFVPVLAFTLTPILQLIINIFIVYDYYYLTDTANLIAGVMGFLTIFMYIGKMHAEKYKLSDFAKEHKPVIFFFGVVLFMLVSTFANGISYYTLHGDDYRHEKLITFIIYFTVYFLCASIIKSGKLKSIIMYIYITGSIVLGICGLIHLKYPIRQFIHYINQTDFSLIFSNSNHYGYYIVIAVMLSSSLFIHEKSNVLKTICMISFLINNIILIINNTFGCYLACLFALIFNVIVLYIKDKKINKSALALIILFFIISAFTQIFYGNVLQNIYSLFTDISNIASKNENAEKAGSNRWKLWEYTLKYISEKPVLGFGVEGIAERLKNDAGNSRTHNEFLQYAAFFGIPAGIMYICGIMSVFLNGLKNKAKLDKYQLTALVAAFGYLVSSFFGNTMYYTAPFLFIFLGLGFTKSKKINIKED